MPLIFSFGKLESKSLVFTSDQAQPQAIGITPVKTKSDANTSTSKIIPTYQTVKMPEVIWIQCFHCFIITTCGKDLCACAMPERYFVFACCLANARMSTNTR